MDHDEGTALVGGDFNTTFGERAEHVVECFRDSGFNLPEELRQESTFGARILRIFMPLQRLDHMVVRAGRGSHVTFRYGVSRLFRGSDHRPLSGDLRFEAPAAG